jgi:putative Holliday junction resolvase
MTTMGLDVGERRIGVALSDPTGLIARPHFVLFRESNERVCKVIAGMVAANGVGEIVVGLPVVSESSLGEQGRRTLRFVRQLRRHVAVPIATWDEAYSSEEAMRLLIQRGTTRLKRKSALDAAAAAVILQEWLDRRSSGPRPSADEIRQPTPDSL